MCSSDLSRLAADRLEIAVPETPDDTPLDLAPLTLPLDPDVAAGALEALVIRRGREELFRAENLRFAAALIGSRVDVTALDARLFDADLHAAGRIDIERQLPLALTARATRAGLPPVSASVRGDLRKLALDARVAGEWPFVVTGTVEPLGDHLPVDLALRAEIGRAHV